MEVIRTFASTHKAGKAATIMYAMGTTQHTHGTQNVRSYAMLQLLLGNVGLAGGGINALRGESNVQGSTDYAILYHILPGYLKVPTYDNKNLQAYNDKWTPKTNDPQSANWWSNTPKYMTSLLKAYWGDAATAKNEWGIEAVEYLPVGGHLPIAGDPQQQADYTARLAELDAEADLADLRARKVDDLAGFGGGPKALTPIASGNRVG